MSSRTVPFARPAELSRDNRLHSYLVYIENLTVVFDGFKALDIDLFGLYHNELRVIIGPNGAGKTTLCDVISGRTKPSSGRVFLRGYNIDSMPEHERARQGIGRKFQTPTVFDSLTVFENMELALPGRRSLWRNLFSALSSEESDRIDAMLLRVRLFDQRDQAAKYLSHGQRQCLEIAMLIMAEPKLLLVDEPAAGLSDDETSLLVELLLELRGQQAIIVIEHDMEFVRRLEAPVTVLNEGRIMAEGDMEEIQANAAVVEAYLGR